ncbi:isopentenyl-diphosphate Delta-isomerase [Cryobacterium algoritolerans]|uniref:Isopentenyl-diphosphate Delta-isomerase n=1 Tax=Cryobacterium algoritolerans TaxID=1259184 RepID=A0A4R8WJL5_9MICO|nr:isopentenyl-diphosphate Delta-isomerase [Cryobacterium algoritolerans]TFC11010.1 isopentenyl-diphosphate Delta-isomerase [Cryobacterium algoritolerans]
MAQIELLAEHVVLVDESGSPIGTAPKITMHDADTRLHLAFSCYVLDPLGQVLITRRSLVKKTWPGVWTNSFCGHPLPGESIPDAIDRRARFELGLALDCVTVILPDFRYRAVDSSGIVENEICPVYVATASGDPVPNPDEVVEFAWVDPATLRRSVLDLPWAFSPWLGLQMKELTDFGA